MEKTHKSSSLTIAANQKKKEMAFWMEVYAEDFERSQLPYDTHSLDKGQQKETSTYQSRLRDSIATKLIELSKGNHQRLLVILVTELFLLLKYYTGKDDLTLGMPVFKQEEKVKLLNRVLPLRIQIQEQHTFRQILNQVRSTITQAVEHQNYPMEVLLEKLGITMPPQESPLFDVGVLLTNIQDIRYLGEWTPNLIFSFGNQEQEISITITYNSNYYKKAVIQRILDNWETLLENTLYHLEIPETEIEILQKREKQKIIHEFNEVLTENPETETVQQVFEKRVLEYPESLAVVYKDLGLTYQELKIQADILTVELKQKGARPNIIVALLVDVSIEMMVAIMAVLKTGAAYLPMDLETPDERVIGIIKDSMSTLLITKEKLGRVPAITSDPEINEMIQQSQINLCTISEKPGRKNQDIEIDSETFFKNNRNHPKDLAYIIYTSGSTGKPKGVMINQDSFVDFVTWAVEEFEHKPGYQVLLSNSYAFDGAVQQIFPPLASGGTLFLVEKEIRLDIQAYFYCLKDNKINNIDEVPALMNEFFATLELDENREMLPALTNLSLGSEFVPIELIKNCRKYLNHEGKIINAYGPAESTVETTTYHYEGQVEEEVSLIGKPRRNINVWILDKAGKMSPIGVPGEICVSGRGLSRGYLNRPELTAEKFQLKTRCTDQPVYRTGDRGYWQEDGNIHFSGREDNQVKIRGYRIELGEIESQLNKIDFIHDAVVMVRKTEENTHYLCAYIVAESHQVTEVREALSRVLPDYMVPQYIIPIEKLPLTVNGKVDKKALPEPCVEIGIEYQPPRNTIERKLACIWSDLLKVDEDKIGIYTDFFELGGYSLKATRLISKVQKEFNIAIPLNKFFEEPHIAAMASQINQSEKSTYESIKPVEKREYYALSSAQKRLYILQQMDLSSTSYNMPLIVPLYQAFEFKKLETAFEELLKRHNSFRMCIQELLQEPHQRIYDQVELLIQYYNKEKRDLTETDINNLIRDFIKPFDLGQAPFMRVGLIYMPEKSFLMVDIHHIISDGITHQVLETEFVQLFRGETLPTLRLQYTDYSEWQKSKSQQKRLEEQEKYWMQEFFNELPVLQLPLDYPRPTIQSFEGSSISFSLSNEKTSQLKELVKETNTTLFMVLVAVFNILLSKLSGQEDIIIGTPIAGRRHADLEQVVGMFVNTLALRNYPKAGLTFKGFLHQLKERTLRVFENQEYQFEDLVNRITLQRDTSRNPIFDVVFNLIEQDNMDEEVKEAKEIEKKSRYKFNSSKFDLTLRAFDQGNRIFFNMEYCIRLFKEETIERMKTYLHQVINSILSNPSIPLTQVELYSEAEKDNKIQVFNQDLESQFQVLPIQEHFNRIFEQCPEHIAIEYGEEKITYQQLEQKAWTIYQWIQDSQIPPGTPIGVYLDNKVDIIASLIGILYARCLYVPMDKKQPIKLLHRMIAHTEIHHILGERQTIQISQLEEMGITIEQIKNLNQDFYQEYQNKKRQERKGGQANKNQYQYHIDDPIYIYFTSGTTGVPNGIVGRNGSLMQFIQWEISTFSVDTNTRISQLAAVGFDAFLRNVLTPLLAGGTVCIPRDTDLVIDSKRLKEWIQHSRVNLVHCVPSVFRLISSESYGALSPEPFPHLKYVLLSGEQVKPRELMRWYDIMGNRVQLVNCYGATETTVIRTFHFIQPSEAEKARIPVGKPLKGTQAVILDKNHQICPTGVEGEIYIRTPFSTYGYLNNPLLNSQRFIQNPLRSEEAEKDVLYRTGDLGRELENGEIEVLDRIDRQVKVRGVRIELESIENLLQQHPDIQKSVVIQKQIQEAQEAESHLCAYVIPKKFQLWDTEGTHLDFDIEPFIQGGDQRQQQLKQLELKSQQEPGKIAISSQGHTLTYGELWGKSGQLSEMTEKGSGTKEKVALLLDNVLELLVAIIGILRSGVDFILLEPHQATEEILEILSRNQVHRLMTHSHMARERIFTALQGLNASKGEIHTAPARKPIEDLNTLPFPDRSLVNYEKYTQYIGQSLIKNSFTLLGSRGCPYNCAYCHNIWPKKQLSRTAENIYQELNLFYQVGFRRFVFLDDIFNLDVNNSGRFLKKIIENQLEVQLCLNLRGDILTKEFIDLMVKAGVIRMAFALETGSARLQKLIVKNLNLKRFKESMDYISTNYPQVILEINTMHGFPTETEEEARSTLEFIKSIKWVHFPYINILKIYPNTEMEKIALEKGISKEAINQSSSLAYHELPETLPFDKAFTKKYQLEFMSDYFLLKDRLLQVLPWQLKVLTEDEIVQKYNSYLPVEIQSLEQLLEFVQITRQELGLKEVRQDFQVDRRGESCIHPSLLDNLFNIPELNHKIQELFPTETPEKGRLKLLLLDLSQNLMGEQEGKLYDVVEAPLGLMYLASYLKNRYQGKVEIKIAKSRIDFDNFKELWRLCQEFQPDLIGIRTLTYFSELLHRVVSYIRHWGFTQPIVAGGPYATSDYKRLLQDRNIDLAIIGEGEQTLTELIGTMLENQNQLPPLEQLGTIPGIAYNKGENRGDFKELILLDALDLEVIQKESASSAREISPLGKVKKMDVTAMRDYLSRELPGYMIPSFFIPIQEIPLTVNGKIDIQQLPAPGLLGEHSDVASTSTEQKLVEIWAEVLQVDKEVVGIDTDFFELGGHSLKATILISKIHKEFEVRLPFSKVFQTPFIKELAEYIDHQKKEAFTRVEAAEKREYYPISISQGGIFMQQMKQADIVAYNMPLVMELDRDTFHLQRIQDSMRRMIQRHECLRTSFEVIEGAPSQRILEISEISFDLEIYQNQQDKTVKDMILEFIRPFELNKPPLVRVGIIFPKEVKGNFTVMLDTHHIISDGVSHEIFQKEFMQIYRKLQLPPLRIQYKDYCFWQGSSRVRESIQEQKNYWKKQFKIEIPSLSLPNDFPRQKTKGFKGDHIFFEIDEALTAQLNQVAGNHQITLYIVLLTSYFILLSKFGNYMEIVVGSPVTGRKHIDLGAIIGMFVNMLAIKARVQPDKTVRDFFREVKEIVIASLENQDYHFEELVKELGFQGNVDRNPLFDVVFSMQNFVNPKQEKALSKAPEVENKDSLRKSTFTDFFQVSKFDLLLNASEIHGKIEFMFEYSSSLFKPNTIENISNHYVEILKQVVESSEATLADISITFNLVKVESQEIFEDGSFNF